MNQQEKLHLINEIFTPSSPVENKELFSGRLKELEQIKLSITERGQHAVMYGPRGAGKTSLANMAYFLFDDLLTVKVTCHRNDTFNTIWERALRKIKLVDRTIEPGYKPTGKIEAFPIYVPEKEYINHTLIESVLSELKLNILFIFDEFDIIRSAEVKSQMADMIKLFSDNLPFITVLIVGISQSVDRLIGEHQSIERCIKQIELPLMNEAESKELIKDNLSIIGLTVKRTILNQIIDLSSGFPHYIHLLCKYAANEAVMKGRKEILADDFDLAIKMSIDNSDYSIRNAYQKATSHEPRNNRMADLLLACALASTDHDHSFGSIEVIHQLNKISGIKSKPEDVAGTLGILCRREGAEILTKLGRMKNARYKFRKPLIKAFVKLKKFEKTIK